MAEFSDIMPSPLRAIPKGAPGALRLINGSVIHCTYTGRRAGGFLEFDREMGEFDGDLGGVFHIHRANILSFTTSADNEVCVCGEPLNASVHVSNYVTGLSGHVFVPA